MNKLENIKHLRIVILILLAIYSIFQLLILHNQALAFRYAIYWRLDFDIYYDAVQAAQAGQSAYFPYGIGTSYLYPPATLSLLSLFAFIGQSKQTAMMLWVIANCLAYILSIILALNLLSKQSMTIQTGIVILFIFFSPFLEMVLVGQISALMTLALVLTFHFSEKQQPLGAGISLAAAITMKFTPIVFLAYFFVLRRYREMAVTIIALAVFHGIAWLQFGPQVFRDYVAIFSHVSSESALALPLNRSFTSTFRFVFPELAGRFSLNTVGWYQKGLIAVIGGVVLGSLWFQNTPTLRQLVFGIVTVLMTVASPLLWNHHNVFLIYPLLLLLVHPDLRIFLLGVVTLAVLNMQFFVLTNMVGVPTLLAHILLIAILCILYMRNYLLFIRPIPAGDNKVQAAQG